jgi:hypothetical protein
VIWLGFVAFWTFMAIAMGAPLFFPLFSLPFWAVGIFLVKALLQPALTSIDLNMTKEGGVLLTEEFVKEEGASLAPERSWQLFGQAVGSYAEWQGRYGVGPGVGTKTIRFGKALSPRERKVIARAINAWRKS